jgi:hypothetical protein
LTTARDTGPIAIAVAPKGSIHGRLATDKQEVSHWTIVLLPAFTTSNDLPLKVTFADSAARFAFERLRPGRYRIAARPANDLSKRWIPDLSGMQEIEVRPGVITDIELRTTGSDVSGKE